MAVNDRDPTQMALPQLVELYAIGAVNASTPVWRVDDATRRRPFDFPEIATALKARGFEHPRTVRRDDLPAFGDQGSDEATVIASPSLRERFPELHGWQDPGSAPRSSGSRPPEPRSTAPTVADAEPDQLAYEERTVAVDSSTLLDGLDMPADFDVEAHDDGLGVARLPDDPVFDGVAPTRAVLARPREDEEPAWAEARRPGNDDETVAMPRSAAATEWQRAERTPAQPDAEEPAEEGAQRSPVPPSPPPVPPTLVSASDDLELEPPRRKRGCFGRLVVFGVVAVLVAGGAVVGTYLIDPGLLLAVAPELRGLAPALFPTAAAPPASAPTAAPSASAAAPRVDAGPGDAAAGGAPPLLDAAVLEAEPPADAGLFDRNSALAALAEASKKAMECYDPETPVFGGHVIVSFEPTGRVSNVVPQGQFAGNKVGLCVATTFKDIRIAPFSGQRVPISHPLTIRP